MKTKSYNTILIIAGIVFIIAGNPIGLFLFILGIL